MGRGRRRRDRRKTQRKELSLTDRSCLGSHRSPLPNRTRTPSPVGSDRHPHGLRRGPSRGTCRIRTPFRVLHTDRCRFGRRRSSTSSHGRVRAPNLGECDWCCICRLRPPPKTPRVRSECSLPACRTGRRTDRLPVHRRGCQAPPSSQRLARRPRRCTGRCPAGLAGAQSLRPDADPKARPSARRPFPVRAIHWRCSEAEVNRRALLHR